MTPITCLFISWLLGLAIGFFLGRIIAPEPEMTLRPRSVWDVQYCHVCDSYVTPRAEHTEHFVYLLCPTCDEEIDLWKAC